MTSYGRGGMRAKPLTETISDSEAPVALRYVSVNEGSLSVFKLFLIYEHDEAWSNWMNLFIQRMHWISHLLVVAVFLTTLATGNSTII